MSARNGASSLCSAMDGDIFVGNLPYEVLSNIGNDVSRVHFWRIRVAEKWVFALFIDPLWLVDSKSL